jgi:hypothetical protein
MSSCETKVIKKGVIKGLIKGVKKGVKNNIRKSNVVADVGGMGGMGVSGMGVSGVGVSGMGVSGMGVDLDGVIGVNELRADIVHSSVLRIIDDYKPFLDVKYHSLFDSFPSNHIPFVHFLIFLIWFLSPFNLPIQLFDLFSIYLHFNRFPFHSCLFHIKRFSH